MRSRWDLIPHHEWQATVIGWLLSFHLGHLLRRNGAPHLCSALLLAVALRKHLPDSKLLDKWRHLVLTVLVRDTRVCLGLRKKGLFPPRWALRFA